MSETSRELHDFYGNPLVIASIARLRKDGITCMDYILELAQHASIEIDILYAKIKELEAQITRLTHGVGE